MTNGKSIDLISCVIALSAPFKSLSFGCARAMDLIEGQGFPARSQPGIMELQPEPNRLKGILALMPTTVTHYPYDDLEWKRKGFASITKRRRAANQQQTTACTLSYELPEILASIQDTAVVFLFDPLQPYSIRLLKKLVQVQLMSSSASSTSASTTNGTIHCFVLSQREDNAADALLNSSGLYRLAGVDDTKFTVLQVACGFCSCPALAVVECRAGRKVCGAWEELALDWNEAEHTVEHWQQGETALTAPQQVKARLLYPSCTIS